MAISIKIDDWKERESFGREAVASWAQYQKPGQHLTGREVRSWLNTRGTLAETEMPDCHE
jgi:predicted transcriptional regulator